MGKGEIVSYDTVLTKILKTGAWVSEDMVHQMLFGIIHKSEIAKLDLLNLLNLERYIDGYTHTKYLINKATFLNAIVTVYDEMWFDEGSRIYESFLTAESEEGIITKKAFIQKAIELDLCIPYYELDRLYNEGVEEGDFTGEVAYKQAIKRLQSGVFNIYILPDFEQFSSSTQERKSVLGSMRPSISSLSFPISRLTI